MDAEALVARLGEIVSLGMRLDPIVVELVSISSELVVSPGTASGACACDLLERRGQCVVHL